MQLNWFMRTYILKKKKKNNSIIINIVSTFTPQFPLLALCWLWTIPNTPANTLITSHLLFKRLLKHVTLCQSSPVKTCNTLSKFSHFLSIWEYLMLVPASQVVLVVKNLPANARDIKWDVGLIPGLGRSPGGGYGTPLQYSCLENPMLESLGGYSPWGHKESDTTIAT